MIPQEYPRTRTFEPLISMQDVPIPFGEIYERIRAEEGAIDRPNFFTRLFFHAEPRCCPSPPCYFPVNLSSARTSDQRTICLRNFLI